MVDAPILEFDIGSVGWLGKKRYLRRNAALGEVRRLQQASASGIHGQDDYVDRSYRALMTKALPAARSAARRTGGSVRTETTKATPARKATTAMRRLGGFTSAPDAAAVCWATLPPFVSQCWRILCS